MNFFGNKETVSNHKELTDIRDFTGSKLLSNAIIIVIDNQKIVTIDNLYLLVYWNKEVYKIKTDSRLFVNIMGALNGLPMVTPFQYLDVKGEKVTVGSEGLASASVIDFREKMLNGDYGKWELVLPDTLTRFIGNKEFKFFTSKSKEKLVVIPIWDGHVVMLDTKGIAIWFDGQVSIALKGDKLYKGIVDILSCMEVNSKFVFLKVTPESVILTASPEITEEMREFRENLAFGKYGEYKLKELIKLRYEE